jgi:predicted transcriptional regulator
MKTSDEIAREITRTRRAIGYLETAAERLGEIFGDIYAAERVSGLNDLIPVYVGRGSETFQINFTPGAVKLFTEINRATKRLEEKIQGLIKESQSLSRSQNPPSHDGRNTKGRTIH